jgi:hypothetical protein
MNSKLIDIGFSWRAENMGLNMMPPDGDYKDGDISPPRQIVQPYTVSELAKRRRDDTRDFNFYQPEGDYQDAVIQRIDVSVIKPEAMTEEAERIFFENRRYNRYNPPGRRDAEIREAAEILGEEREYLEKVDEICDFIGGGAYNLAGFLVRGVDERDSELGKEGQRNAVGAIEGNFRAGLERDTIGRINTNVVSLLAGSPLINRDYKITRARGLPGRALDFLRRAQGIGLPLFRISEEGTFSGRLDGRERNSFLLDNTGIAVTRLMINSTEKNLYYGRIFGGGVERRGNEYGGDKKNYLDGFYQDIDGDRDDYGFLTEKGGAIPGTLIDRHLKDVDFQNPEAIGFPLRVSGEGGISVWDREINNGFVPNSLMSNMKKRASEGDVFFPDSYSTEMSNEKGEVISRGNPVTNRRAFVDDDGTSYQANEFFRVFTKKKMKDRLSRAYRHRALDADLERSVLGKNGLVMIAPTLKDGRVIRKFMFSIANMAWKGNAGDLAECEKYISPEGDVGRLMWFAPYNLKISESVSQSVQPRVYFGRNEPIFTSNNTQRSLSLSFRMIKDYPSVINKVKGIKNHIWERFFQGDKSIEEEIRRISDERLTPDELEILDGIRKLNKKPVIVSNQDLEAAPEPEPERDVPNEIEVLSIYFPNEETSLPDNTNGDVRRNAGYEDSFGTMLGYTYLNGQSKRGNILYIDQNNLGLNSDFFSGGNSFAQILRELFLEDDVKGITVRCVGYASAPKTPRSSNFEISRRRANEAELWAKKKFEEESLAEFNLRGIPVSYEVESRGDIDDLDTPEDSRGDNPSAKRARRATIFLTAEREGGEVMEAAAEISENNEPPIISDSLESGLNEAQLRVLSKISYDPCGFFKYLEINQPYLFDTISEKIDYFEPAFHSQTPQDFNERLTFLHQCLRTSNNIPLREGGGPTNLFYGYQPYVYIQIGDFFKAKAMINSLRIEYSAPNLAWDLNPESGVGVEPMFADISLDLNIVGGQTMSGAINRLQNALSFNYYANTELYETRSDSIIFDADGGGLKGQIISGVRGVRKESFDTLFEEIEARRSLGQISPAQDRFSTPPSTFVPSELEGFDDIIQLKRALNLTLTEDEAFFLQNQAGGAEGQ